MRPDAWTETLEPGPLAANHRQCLPGITRAVEIRRPERPLERLPRPRPITSLNVGHSKVILMERIRGIAIDAFLERCDC